MKHAIILSLVAATSLLAGCISRTTTTEKGFGGGEKTNTQTIWFWQSEFYNTH